MYKYETIENVYAPIKRMHNDVFLKIIFFLNWLTCIGFLYDKQILISMGNYTISIMILFSSLYFSLKKTNRKSLLIMLCILIFFSVNLSYKIINNIYLFEFRNFMYILLIFFLIICSKYFKVKKSDVLFMITLSMFLTLLFILKLSDNTMYEYYSSDYALNLNFSNPNVLGSVLLTNLIYISLGFIYVNQKIIKLILMCIVLANIYLIYLTESRSSFFTGILFMIMVIIFKNNLNIGKKISKIIGWVPLVCVVFSSLISKVASLNIFKSSGKIGLSSREEIWQYVINNSFIRIESLIFGGNYTLSISNPHNIYLYLLWDYGLFISLFLILLIIFQIIKAGRKISNVKENVSFFGFSIILLNNSFETHLFIGIIGISFLSFLLLSQYPQNEN